MRRHLPRFATDPLPSLGRRPPGLGTCGRSVSAAARFSSVCRAHSSASPFPNQVSGAPPGQRRGQAGRARGPASAGRTSPTQPHTQTPRMALTGLDCSCASAFPRGSMALPDPRVRPLRHTAPPRKWTPAAPLCGPARPRRGVAAATRLGEVGPTLSPRAGAPGERPRGGRGLGSAAGPGGDGRTTASRGPGCTWCDGGVGGGDEKLRRPHGAPDSTRGPAASTSFPRENTARNLAQGQPS